MVEMIIHMVGDEDFSTTAYAVAFRLTTTVSHRTAIVEQHLTKSRACINTLEGIVQQ
jgi:hypothetical protein